MPSQRHKWLVFGVFAALSANVCRADNTVTAGITGTRWNIGKYAYGGSLTWQEAMTQGGVLVNLSSESYPVGSLSTVDVDAYRHVSPALVLSGGVSFGDANSGPSSDPLFKARLAVDARIDSTWSVHLADQFTDLDVIHGQLLTVGTQYMVSPLFGVSVAVGHGISGTVADRYVALSFNSFGPLQTYGGVVYGRSGYDPDDLGQISVIRRLIQVYGGFSLPLRYGRLIFGADALDLEGFPRQTLRIGYTQTIK